MLKVKRLFTGYNSEIILSLTRSLIKSRYRKTFAGLFWVVLNPILTFLVQALVFKHILKIVIPDYYLFLLSGLVPWIFLTSTMNMTVTAFVVNRPSLMAFKLDPWIFIVSQTIDNAITFVISFTFLLMLNGDPAVVFGLKLPMFLLTSLLFCVATYFICFLLATMHVFLRDTQYILQFVLNLAFFVTPVFYPEDLIPVNLRWLISYNPLYIIIKPFQSIFWKYDLALYAHDSLRAIGALIVLIFICSYYWRKKKYELYFRI